MGTREKAGYNSHSIYCNYSQSNFRCGGGWSNDKIEAVSRGRSTCTRENERERERGSYLELWNAALQVVGFHGQLSAEWRVVSEEYFDRNEWLCGPRTAIEFQAVLVSFQGGRRCLPASVSAATEQLTDPQFFRFCENFARKGTTEAFGGFWIVEVADVEG